MGETPQLQTRWKEEIQQIIKALFFEVNQEVYVAFTKSLLKNAATIPPY